MKKTTNNQNLFSGGFSGLLALLLILTFALACHFKWGDTSDVKKSNLKTVSTVKTENARTIDADDKEEVHNEVENEEGDSLVKKVCRKYDSCGAQSYDDCMAEAEKVNYDDEVYECILKSSCKSLKLGQPDACSGAGNNPPVYEQRQAPCPQIRCSQNADCPGTCYGDCKNGICLLF